MCQFQNFWIPFTSFSTVIDSQFGRRVNPFISYECYTGTVTILYSNCRVDATHVRVVLGIIDDFFRDKSTFCELIFGSQGTSDYTIGELKAVSALVFALFLFCLKNKKRLEEYYALKSVNNIT